MPVLRHQCVVWVSRFYCSKVQALKSVVEPTAQRGRKGTTCSDGKPPLWGRYVSFVSGDMAGVGCGAGVEAPLCRDND